VSVRTLVLGANGQDGSYLVEALLGLGADVVGVGRNKTSRYVRERLGYRYVCLDLSRPNELERLLVKAAPELCFHVAAVHGAVGAGFTYEAAWRDMMTVNVFSLHALLEHARLRAPSMRIVYANSAKVFPAPWHGTLDEASPMRATCLYGIGKMVGRDLMARYRNDHGVETTNLILFNHDSPRRPAGYFLPVIADTIRRALRDRSHVMDIRSLSFWMDWSAADEIMDLLARAAVKGVLPPEMVVASGRTVAARDIVTRLFCAYGLAVHAHLRELSKPFDPGSDFRVDITRFAGAVGSRPKKTVFDIVDDMIRAA
jgi:GDPmannose 4,6-dehydratase